MVRCILRTPSLQHKSPKTDVSVVSMRFVQLNRMQWIAAGGRISLSFTFHMLLFMYWIRLHSFDVVRLGHRHLNFSNRQHCDCKINRNTLNLLVYGYYVPLPARHTDHDHMFFFFVCLSLTLSPCCDDVRRVLLYQSIRPMLCMLAVWISLSALSDFALLLLNTHHIHKQKSVPIPIQMPLGAPLFTLYCR